MKRGKGKVSPRGEKGGMRGDVKDDEVNIILQKERIYIICAREGKYR